MGVGAQPACGLGASTPGAAPRRRLAVVIINFRTPGMVLDCLATLDGQVDPGRDEVVVVDNESGDDSAAAIRAGIEARGWSGWARVVEAGRNGGFSAGNNVGVRSSDAEFYLLLNSDTLVRPGAIAGLLEAAERLPQAGLIGPRLEYPDGTAQVSAFRVVTPCSQLVTSAHLSFLSRLLRPHLPSIPVSDEPHEAGWVSFACVLVRRAVFERIGPMDEGMFMYFEDIDTACRARDAGFRAWYWPAARVVHLRGGTSSVKRNAAERRPLPGYYYAARARYLHRRFGRVGLILGNLLWEVGFLMNHACRLLTGRRVGLPARGWRDVWITRADTPAGPRGVGIEPPIEPLFRHAAPGGEAVSP